MNLEKLGLILFIKYMRQFEVVKHHLVSSIRELLLAMSSTLELTNQITTDNFLLRRFSPLEATFKKIDSILNYSIEQLEIKKEADNSDQTINLKDNIVESIITVIDEEIDKLSDSKSLNKDLKVEALFTVKDVLKQHINNDQNTFMDDIIEVDNAANS